MSPSPTTWMLIKQISTAAKELLEQSKRHDIPVVVLHVMGMRIEIKSDDCRQEDNRLGTG